MRSFNGEILAAAPSAYSQGGQAKFRQFEGFLPPPPSLTLEGQVSAKKDLKSRIRTGSRQKFARTKFLPRKGFLFFCSVDVSGSASCLRRLRTQDEKPTKAERTSTALINPILLFSVSCEDASTPASVLLFFVSYATA